MVSRLSTQIQSHCPTHPYANSNQCTSLPTGLVGRGREKNKERLPVYNPFLIKKFKQNEHVLSCHVLPIFPSPQC